MNKIILQMPTRIAMELTSWNTADPDIGSAFVRGFLAPFDTNLGGKTSDILIVFKISPKFYLGARLSVQYFTNYGDDWCDVPPGAAPDY